MLIDIGGKNLLMSYLILEGARASTGLCVDVISSSVLSFTQFFPICGRMPLPALSLWPGRQPYRSRLVDGRLGCGPSYVAPRSRNRPTRRRRDCPISSSLFSHDPPPVRIRLRARQRNQSSPDPAGNDWATSSGCNNRPL